MQVTFDGTDTKFDTDFTEHGWAWWVGETTVVMTSDAGMNMNVSIGQVGKGNQDLIQVVLT